MNIAPQIQQLDPAALDYSMLGHSDLVNIVLQRSEILHDIPKPGQVIRSWVDGDTAPLDEIVQAKGAELAQRAVQIIGDEVKALHPTLDRLKPSKIADIGCGYGFFDLFAHRRYGSDLLLIDIEDNEHRHFGFEDEAAGYTSLQTAKRFLQANGVPQDSLSTWNPEQEDAPEAEKLDLAVSFLSCGFHFPVDMYMPFFRFGIAPGGAVILDLRAGRVQENNRILKKLGHVQVLSEGNGRKRVLVRKGRK